jgi:integrase
MERAVWPLLWLPRVKNVANDEMETTTMGVFRRGDVWWYVFRFEGQRIRESAKTSNKELAKRAEEDRRREMRDDLLGVDSRKERARMIRDVADDYLKEYKSKHESFRFLMPALGHLKRLLGDRMIAQIDTRSYVNYQTARLNEGAAGRTVNLETGILLRMIGSRGDQLRLELKRKKQLTVKQNNNAGKAYNVGEQDRLLEVAKESDSPHVNFALQLALNGGMRDKEIKTLKWSQIDFVKNILIVGQSKNDPSTGRVVPLNGELLEAFQKHYEWFVKKFGELKPEWYIFPFGRPFEMDPAKHVTTLKTAWRTVRAKAGVQGRWHDTRHTVVTELGESGASPATIKASVGHVSQRMLDRYSHPNIEAQRRAFENITTYRKQQRKKLEANAARARSKQRKDETPATVN